jgi:hypothetical protein
MSRWRHQRCGSVYFGAVPPLDCEVCVGSSGPEEGWSLVDRANEPAAGDRGELPPPRRAGRGPRCAGPALRKRVFERDGWKCCRCGCSDREQLTTDHVVPWSRGGPTTFENLQTLCGRCNREKGND